MAKNMIVDTPVTWFFDQTNRKLDENAWKSGWEEMTLRALLKRLKEEVVELEKEICKPKKKRDSEKIINEAADVSNFAMFIAHNALPEQKPERNDDEN